MLSSVRNTRSFGLRNLHALWQSAFYALPLALLVWISFWQLSGYSLRPAFSFENYAALFSTGRYIVSLGNSLSLGLSTAVLTVLLALPLAYALHTYTSASLQRALLVALMFPFFSSFVLRVFGWQAWLSNTGILAWALNRIRGPSGSTGFLYTPAAAGVGLVSVLLPVTTVIIFLSLARIEAGLVLAARNLGASRWRTFRSIQFPFLVPALLISFLFSLLTALGDVVCVSILGGNRTYYVSNAIQDQIKINNWPLAAALGSILLVLSLGFLAVAFAIVRYSPAAHSAPQRNVAQ